jgi:hypothetical protein
MLFGEQKLAHNQLFARVAFVALGKYTLFLPILLHQKRGVPQLGRASRVLVFYDVSDEMCVINKHNGCNSAAIRIEIEYVSAFKRYLRPIL